MPEDRKLSALTRSLLLGVSLGTVGLTQVGCTDTANAPGTPVVRGVTGNEAALLDSALTSKSVRDVNAFLSQYPRSRGVAPLLTSLPPSTLAALSPRAVAGIPASTVNSLPANVQRQLPGTQTRRAAAPPGPRQVQGTIIRRTSDSDY
jgi:hypothetical protein